MRILARTLGITALMMAPAFSALAQEPPPPAATEPPPATTPPPAAAPAMASPGAFGSLGQIVLSVDLPFMNEGPQFAIVHHSISDGGGSGTDIAIMPSADYFLAPHISVGGQIMILHHSDDFSYGGTTVTGSETDIGVEVRGGYELALTDSISLWPRLGIGYLHRSLSGGGQDSSGYRIPLIVSVPVLWHPASHFFIGAGPSLYTDLASKLESTDAGKETDIGVTAILGGYFGGV
jgi:hypothetical protein